MLRSMTGYGAASGAAGEHALAVSVKAVNHRHLQVKARLGSELAALEGEVEKRVRARLSRGAVSVHLSLERAAGVAPVCVDPALARAYVDQLRDLSRDLRLEAGLDLRTVIGLPGVMASTDEPGSGEALGPVLLSTLDEALDALVEMRAAEGAALELDLRENLAELRTLAARVAERMPIVVVEHKAALEERISELIGDATVSQSDLAREIAVLSDRLDVSEELSRLKSHLDQFDALLGAAAAEGGEAVGRKLDFLCQELFREVNTIGSKCNDATVAHWIVDAKTHAERLREQVQNVE